MSLNTVVSRLAVVGVLTGSLASCGQKQARESNDSTLEWVKSRTTTTRYAYLEERDLKDEFVFGASVIAVDGFQSAALNMSLRPLSTKLIASKVGTATKLVVATVEKSEAILKFDLKRTKDKRYEIDFASSGNDLEFKELIDVLGGIYTAGRRDGIWVSSGKPTVLGVQQDDDTVVVDLQHTVKQAVALPDGTIDHVVSDKAGKVTVRLYLKRKSSFPQINVDRSVDSGIAQSVGYFGSDDMIGGKIQRFAVGDVAKGKQTITFFLKNVPAKFEGVARSAILSWNKAFKDDVEIKVEKAPEGLDVGDPRFNVVKWFNGLDEETSWAGVAKMLVHPDNGLVMGGHLFLNGGTVLKGYESNVAFSKALTSSVKPTVFNGTIGGVKFDRDEGETPVLPFITQPGRDYDDYMQGYYEETIAHEIGHVIGLRHNFRGTVSLENNESQSVMDYAPRPERAHYSGPGSYDVAAIHWGYYGDVPAKPLAFCTDDDLWKFYDCNQGDWGNPVDSSIHGIVDGVKILTESPVAINDSMNISSLATSLENILKIKKLKDQLPADSRDATVAKIDAAYKYLHEAAAADGLSEENLTIVKANLVKLGELVKKTEDELREAGKI